MKILVVEDSPMLRRSLEEGLRQAGYAVDVAGEGRDGLWRAETGGYDVILLDLMLPGLDGLVVLRELRRKQITSRVLVLTAKDTVHDRVRGLDQGADDYLVKPFALEELLARVRSLCRRGYSANQDEIQIGTMLVQLRARAVSIAGQRIELARREYMLLEYLALRRGEIVTRAEIEEHVYDDRGERTSNVVDATVARLRRKLQGSASDAEIRTLRGMGYCLDVIAT